MDFASRVLDHCGILPIGLQNIRLRFAVRDENRLTRNAFRAEILSAFVFLETAIGKPFRTGIEYRRFKLLLGGLMCATGSWIWMSDPVG